MICQSHVIPQCHHARKDRRRGRGPTLSGDLAVEVDEVVTAVDGDVGKTTTFGVEIGVWRGERSGKEGVRVRGDN